MSDAANSRDSWVHEQYLQHFPKVVAILRNAGVPTSMVEDAAQDVFLVLHRRVADFDDARPAKAWIRGIARRVASDYRRGQLRHERRAARWEAETRGHDPEASALSAQAVDVVGRFLDNLTWQQASVFVMSELYGMRPTEISSLVGEAPSTVHARVHTVRHRFDSAIREYRSTGSIREQRWRRSPRRSGEHTHVCSIATPLSHWMKDTYGEPTLREAALASGLDPDRLLGGSGWAGWRQMDDYFATAHQLASSEEAFLAANRYRFDEHVGALIRFGVWAMDIGTAMERLYKMIGSIVRTSRIEFLRRGPGYIEARFQDDHPVSPHFCLARKGHGTGFPMLWGHGPGRMIERSCQARGDDWCELRLEWDE